VLAKLPEALKTEGFGVLTEIDVRDTRRAKLGVEFRRYKILGACNPPLAHRVLQAELSAGVMLPRNVIVYEDGDHTVVIAVDPLKTRTSFVRTSSAIGRSRSSRAAKGTRTLRLKIRLFRSASRR
jgi:uncharacterized protein (DUF302 family)